MLVISALFAYLLLGFGQVSKDLSAPIHNRPGWAMRPSARNILLGLLVWPVSEIMNFAINSGGRSFKRGVAFGILTLLIRLVLLTSYVYGCQLVAALYIESAAWSALAGLVLAAVASIIALPLILLISMPIMLLLAFPLDFIFPVPKESQLTDKGREKVYPIEIDPVRKRFEQKITDYPEYLADIARNVLEMLINDELTREEVRSIDLPDDLKNIILDAHKIDRLIKGDVVIPT